MDDKNKGLADNNEGDFVLNESGTSVTIDPVQDDFKADDPILENDAVEEEDNGENSADEA